jgi:hypothetical protein
VTDDDLSAEEAATLRRFDADTPPLDIDPEHFAKLLSMALIEQKPGGPELTHLGRERLARMG